MNNIYVGFEKLATLDGFIKETVEEVLSGQYPPRVVEKTQKYCAIGEGFETVADAVKNGIAELPLYIRLDFDDLDDPCEMSYAQYEAWFVDQIARITADNYKNRKSFFWSDWKFTIETRKAVQKLNALDERVLSLLHGIGKQNKLTADQIALLPEFSCEEQCIRNVIDKIKRILSCSKNVIEEFEQECNVHGCK